MGAEASVRRKPSKNRVSCCPPAFVAYMWAMNTASRTAASRTLLKLTSQWLMDQALAETSLKDVVNGLCERLLAAGVPIARAHVSFAVLHPLYRSIGYTWWRGKGLTVEGYRHDATSDGSNRFLKSPYFHLLHHGLEHLRRRLDTGGEAEFPIIDDLRALAMTDYIAYASAFDPDRLRGMVGSWSTDQSGGFAESEINALIDIQRTFAVTCKSALRGDIAKSVLSTYIGKDAGSRVLLGQVKRGDGETIRAALVFGDLRDSTRLAEELGRQDYIESLNAYFDSVAGAFADAGGEILSFVGDGFLAIFPCERHKRETQEACLKVLQASEEAIRRMAATNRERAESGRPALQFGLGLHIGNVMFGNVGLADRLTFSAFGSAVNTASRLEDLTKVHGTPVVASQDFRDYAGGRWELLGEEALRGLDHPVPVWAPVPEGAERPAVARAQTKEALFTDAENVVLLARRKPGTAN
jgi:adenylate cyclase